jgi:drug/metabolite transporter (DMT)-like permease
MIVFDIIAPICFMYGLSKFEASGASLLNNFEIVASSIIAMILFKEVISKKMWVAITLIVISSFILSFEDILSFKFSWGAILVLIATICWGFENNCTRKISSKDPLQIVLLKGIFSGLGSVVIGFRIGETITTAWSVFAVLGVGFVAYGLSIFFYVYTQRLLGAARTSAYYAISPFIGALLSFCIFHAIPTKTYFFAFLLMIVGAWLCAKDEPIFKRKG